MNFTEISKVPLRSLWYKFLAAHDRQVPGSFSRMNAMRSRWMLSLGCLFGLLVDASPLHGAEAPVIRVMSYNLWHGGDAGKQPLEQTAKVIREAQADVVGLQETGGVVPGGQPRPDRGAELAKILGWHYFDQGGRTGILSRYPIGKTSPGKWGARIELPGGQPVYLFNAHFMYIPYQPYQLLDIPYGEYPFIKTEEEAIRFAKQARGAEVERLLKDLQATVEPGATVFVTGDFNEPSHLDWTTAAQRAGKCPVAVAWPTTKRVIDAGFVDTYREAHPDPVASPGLTWTPITKITDPKDRHDRIDFVLMNAGGGKVVSSQVVGESKEFADIVVAPYPSDHRSVVSAVELPVKPTK
jgi:endonuclease/exonuclease/phosphatase family metal-dependent hydrolase